VFVSQVIAMLGKQAKIISDDNLEDLLLVAETSRQPLRNKAIVLLSAKAGLRAGAVLEGSTPAANLPAALARESASATLASMALKKLPILPKRYAVNAVVGSS
jgi:hypothetical protein